MFGIFCKEPLNVTLKGVTSNDIDPSVDLVKTSMLTTMRKFILDDEGLELKISKRGKSIICKFNRIILQEFCRLKDVILPHDNSNYLRNMKYSNQF